VREVVGSNPASPTIFENKQTKVLSIPVSIGTMLTGEAVLLQKIQKLKMV
jgi:hypothetical protein